MEMNSKSKDAGCALGCVETYVMVDYLNALLHLDTSILIIIHLSVDVLESLHTEAVSLGHARRAHLQTWICGEEAHRFKQELNDHSTFAMVA